MIAFVTGSGYPRRCRRSSIVGAISLGAGVAEESVSKAAAAVDPPNVPALPAGQLKGVKWTPLSKQGSYTRVYSETGNPNELRSQLRPVTSAGNETDTDLALFLQGYVTLTLLDGDLGVRDGAAADAVTSRLPNLALP